MYRRNSIFIGSLLLAAIASLIFPALSAAQTDPCLDVSHDSLIFTGDICDAVITPDESDSLTFTVSNCGGGTLAWSAYASHPWIAFSPSAGGNFDSVNVFIDWYQLPIAPDTLLPGDTVFLTGIIWVAAPGASPDTLHRIDIGLWVSCGDNGPQALVVQPSSFSFALEEGATTGDTITITELHGDTMLIDVVSNANWLTVPQFFAPIYTPSTIEFGVHTAGLAPGTYNSTITVTGYNPDTLSAIDTEYVSVALTVTDSAVFTILASPDIFTYNLNVGDSVIGEILFVSEVGGASINFWTYNQNNWLFVDTFDASPLYTPETITFDVRTDGLAEGYYTDSIFIWGDGAGSDPFMVPVRVTVIDTTTPEVLTSPQSLSFVAEEGTAVADSLYVYEFTFRQVPFAFSHQSSWLVVNPLGMYPYFTSLKMAVWASANQLPPGIYYDTIVIFADSSGGNVFDPWYVPVTFEVIPAQPHVVVTPPVFSITSDTGMTFNEYVVVYDQMGTNFEFAVEADPGNTWLDIQTAAGTMPDSVFFDVSTSGLAFGTYSDTVVIYNPLDAPSPYFEKRIPINLFVSPDTGIPYVLYVEPATIDWRFPQHTGGASYVHIFEQYGRGGLFHFGWSASWLDGWVFTQNGPGYTFPCSLRVYSTDSMMTPGFYYDTLWLWPDTDGVSFSPIAIPITLEALPDEPIMAFPNHFQFMVSTGDSIFDNSFVVLSPGTPNLTYDIVLKNNSSWIPWEYPSGQLTVLPTTVDTIHFDIITDGLAPGIYVDTFVIFNPLDSASGYFEITVPITLTIGSTSASAICGDVDNDGIGPDISDLVYLVAFMFLDGPPPPMIEQVKYGGDGDIDITTLTAMVDYMFRFGPPLICPFD